MRIQCTYTHPWIGDVGLLSALWQDRTHGQLLHVAVPVIDHTPWWHWMQSAPADVQAALRHVWEDAQEEQR